MIEEAEKRDHRRIGREMDLFHLQEEAPGQVFWHAKGWAIWRSLEGYMRRRLDRAGYQEVRTPQLLDRKLWEASGHWEKFRESMFLAEVEEESGADKQVAALKPMNCPVPRADLQPGHQVLPRSAASHGGIRLVPSLRAVRRAARHHARARLHPGRRAYFLPRGPDHPGDGALLRAARLASIATSASKASA